MKRILVLLTSILLIAAIPYGLTACFPPDQQELDEHEQQLEEIAHQEERQAVLYWAEYAASIIDNDEQLRNWWDEFYKDYEGEELPPEAKETMKTQVSTLQERYEELHTIASELDTPDACSEAQQLLISYLDTIRSAASSRLMFYETSDTQYVDEARGLEAEGNTIREQFIQEYTDIAQEWNFTG